MPITAENISFTYNIGLPTEKKVLHNVSFSLERGEIISLIGHTGSGKSTLCLLLSGLLAPDCGRITIDGKATTEGRIARRNIGLVFQYPEYQIFSESVQEEIAFAPVNWKMTPEETAENVKYAAETVGLPLSLLGASPYSLSGGEKRKIAIASAISHRPSYLILDEASAGLDRDSAAQLRKMIHSFAADGKGIMIITHDPEEALTLSDKILILEEGKNIFFGTPCECAEYLCENSVKGIALPEILEISKRLKNAGKIKKLACTPESLMELIRKNA
ncbi:MAG: ATP-binding cassette domain-containing protein [Synergistes sp.]|nr:ATP-binding cassette domain-containing protein [Synergistes sp.]